MIATDTHSKPRPPIDIYVVGLGVMSLRQVTREAEDVLRVSRRTFYVDATYGVGDYLRSLGTQAESLLGEYQEGRPRIDTYRAMTVRVLEAALDDPPVSFAVYGSPTFYVYPSALIRAAARPLELNVHVVPGVSSIDTITADLGVDAGTAGLQIFEATGVLLARQAIDPRVPCILMQVEALESGLFTVARSNSDRFRRLQEHLLTFYPPDHIVKNVQSSTHPLFGPRIESFPMAELAERLGVTTLGGTLYLAPTEELPIVDTELAALLHDTSHLDQITTR